MVYLYVRLLQRLTTPPGSSHSCIVHWTSASFPGQASKSKRLFNASKGDEQASFLREVQESRGTQAASEILRELSNCSLWKASTKPTHRASSYQHQPSGLTKILSNSATHSVMTARGDSTPFEGNPLRTPHHHLGPVTQDDKVRECEIIYTLTLTLPGSTCAQGRSRTFHWDQGTNCQHIDKGVPAEHLLLKLPGHVWTVTQDDLVRECEVRCTTELMVRLA